MGRDVNHINVKGNRIGIAGLDEILTKIAQMRVESEEELKGLLLEMVKARNYFPPSVEQDYAESLLKTYCRFLGKEVDEENPVLTIKILGMGCASCERVRQETVTALSEIKIYCIVETQIPI